MRNFFSLLMLITIVGCDIHNLPPKRLNGIQRVMMHSAYRYSLFQKEGKKLVRIEICCEPEIFMDVPSEEPCWAEYISDNYNNIHSCEIHLHSAKEINGGGWSNEDESGQTVILE